MSKQPEHIFVDGQVASKTLLPMVSLSSEDGMIVQLDVADARQVARDILHAAGNAEADAMILKFFSSEGFPEGAGAALMMAFRDFRHSLEHPDDQARATQPEEPQ